LQCGNRAACRFNGPSVGIHSGYCIAVGGLRHKSCVLKAQIVSHKVNVYIGDMHVVSDNTVIDRICYRSPVKIYLSVGVEIRGSGVKSEISQCSVSKAKSCYQNDKNEYGQFFEVIYD